MLNRLTQVEFKDALGAVVQTVKYGYDPLNHRIRKQIYDDSNVLLSDERYVYEGDQVIRVLSLVGGMNATQVLTAGGQTLGELSPTAALSWYATDKLGSVRALVDGGIPNVVVASYDYDSYGNLTAGSDDPTLSVFHYAGYQLDAETGNYYAWNRYYDPLTGDWISADPIGFDSGTYNLYEYVGNDPLNKTDPTGLAEIMGDSPNGPLKFNRPDGSFMISGRPEMVTDPKTGRVYDAVPTYLEIGILNFELTGNSEHLNHWTCKAQFERRARHWPHSKGSLGAYQPAAASARTESISTSALQAGAAGRMGILGRTIGGFTTAPASSTSSTPVRDALAGVCNRLQNWARSNAPLQRTTPATSTVSPTTSSPMVTPTVSVYHKGQLLNGRVSGNRPLSTGTERATVQALARDGRVIEFRVPKDVLRKWEYDGKITRLRDYDNTTKVYNDEIRFDASLADELNTYMVHE
ncbi:MAG: RHS repeat-associated core domain-containing protein [Pirellulales bacterium]